MTAVQYKAIMAKLALIYKDMQKTRTGPPGIFNQPNGGQTPVKSYAEMLKQYKDLALMIRQRKPGYKESSPGLLGAWEGYQWVVDYMNDYPEKFKK